MSNVRQYFDSEFKGFMGPFGSPQWKVNGRDADPPVLWRLVYDHDSRARCCAVYVPAEWASQPYCVALVRDLKWVTDVCNGLQLISTLPGEPPVDMSDCVFTGRVMFYVEGDVAETDRLILMNLATSQSLSLIVRDKTYARMVDARKQPHAFVSHDDRDKDEFARPLAVALTQNLCKVWYDEFSLKVGDSLRTKIEEGLRTCHRCVLILSPNFLANDRWAKREFDSVFTRELIESENRFLPVWCDVTKQQVFNYSPILADRVGINWNKGVEAVTAELLKVLL